MNKELDELLDAGMVEPSASEWSNLVVMFPNSHGIYRICLDFREIKRSFWFIIFKKSNFFSCINMVTISNTRVKDFFQCLKTNRLKIQSRLDGPMKRFPSNEPH